MIDDSRANLVGRSEFIDALDINDLRDQQRATFELRAECNRETLQLDRLWEVSPLPRIIDDTAEKFGTVYTSSSQIGPRGDKHDTRPLLPLRLGARVREVFIAGNEHTSLQAVRGQLIMHRSVKSGGGIKENGFFVLLSKDRTADTPVLTYGRTDAGQPADEVNSSQVALEAVLNAEEISFSGLRPVNVERYREYLEGFDVETHVLSLEEQAKAVAAENNKPWQQVYLDRANYVQPVRGLTMEAVDRLFAVRKFPKRFRRDERTIGILRQNEGLYVEGQDCSDVVTKLQAFFDNVHEPIQTRPDQKVGATADLEHGTQLEKVDPSQISEMDVAHSVIRNWRKPDKPNKDRISPIPYEMFPYYAREEISPDYSKYPELKDYIDTYAHTRHAAELEHDYPGVTEAVKAGSSSEEWQAFESRHPDLSIQTSLNAMNTYDLYKRENSGMFGIAWSEFDKLMGELSKIKVRPSPLAYPYD